MAEHAATENAATNAAAEENAAKKTPEKQVPTTQQFPFKEQFKSARTAVDRTRVWVYYCTLPIEKHSKPAWAQSKITQQTPHTLPRTPTSGARRGVLVPCCSVAAVKTRRRRARTFGRVRGAGSGLEPSLGHFP